MQYGKLFKNGARRTVFLLCALTLLLSGCASSGGQTSGQTLPPIPTTPGAIVTDDFICIPYHEAAELLLWIEHAESLCR